ncbi:MAG: Gfo/Idh/MocA family oxidoreductase [Planctomycetes bacterium]|nr:Gfo/Idh/MocA family oxidoreductase [Planctomycetota bacterium]
MSTISRRKFLATSATVAGASTMTLPASAQPVGANERINIGLIGTGGRCRHLMPALAKVPNTRMIALCDVYEPNLELARRLAEANAATFRDYRDLLGRRDIHAVLIASPDHWHTPMTIDAMAAGKDVYVEKPLTHKMREGAEITAALAKHRRIVQIGTQQRSMPHIIRAKELINGGRIGTVHKVRMTWNRNSDRVRRGPQNVDPKRLDWKRFLGNAPMQDFDEYKFRNWRWFWDFGNGILTDLMVHWLDVAHWVLNVERCERAVSLGQFNTARDVWQTPDTIQTLLQYGNNLQMQFEGTFCNARGGAFIEFMGTEGSMYIDRGRFELIPEPRFPNRKPEEQNLNPTLPRGRDFYPNPDGELAHLQNWIDAIRNNRQPSAPISAGVSAAAAAHLGNEAYRNNRVAVMGK